ncbi:hypothetical protein NQD34_009992 [Periophthalmus magnuspinnatus]|nr:hypothetical protein NQD34_009992 [Periophthalmus magnuspinnatus]
MFLSRFAPDQGEDSWITGGGPTNQVQPFQTGRLNDQSDSTVWSEEAEGPIRCSRLGRGRDTGSDKHCTKCEYCGIILRFKAAEDDPGKNTGNTENSVWNFKS